MQIRRGRAATLTIEHNLTIHRLVGEGHSWRTIAVIMGFCLGMVMRRGRQLGLKTKRARSNLAAPIKPDPKPRTKTRRYIRQPIPTTIIDNGLGHAIDTAIAFSQAQSMSLLEAGPEHCRWPIDGDRNPRCCGGPISRLAYCEEHARRAFNAS
jgi:hypothetical protein